MKRRFWMGLAWFNGLMGAFSLGAWLTAWAYHLLDRVPQPAFATQASLAGLSGLVGMVAALWVAKSPSAKEAGKGV